MCDDIDEMHFDNLMAEVLPNTIFIAMLPVAKQLATKKQLSKIMESLFDKKAIDLICNQ